MARGSRPQRWHQPRTDVYVDHGHFEIRRDHPDVLRERGVPLFLPFRLTDLRSGARVYVAHFRSALAARTHAHPSLPIHHPEEAP